MKEVTEWNGKPRWMLVWDNCECDKTKQFVVCILTKEEMKESNYSHFPVFTISNTWKHCAEIEEEEPKRMTNRELAWWLRDHPEEHRECKIKNGYSVYTSHSYEERYENEPCLDFILIRSNGGEWREPLVEVEE